MSQPCTPVNRLTQYFAELDARTEANILAPFPAPVAEHHHRPGGSAWVAALLVVGVFALFMCAVALSGKEEPHADAADPERQLGRRR